MMYFTVLDVVALTNISRDRIEYAEEHGFLPDPQRWRGRKVYDPQGIETIRVYFAKRPKWSRAH
jgi:DNA-binding transcriptional MerR regulator